MSAAATRDILPGPRQAEILTQFAVRFGAGFHRCAQKAIRLSNRRGVLEAFIRDQTASSLEGAMYQVMLANSVLEVWGSAEIQKEELDRVSADLKSASKALHSVLRVLEGTTGLRAEDMGGFHYMSEALDPHAMLSASMSGAS